ncbi:glycoside hydrolase family 16 protein [Rhizobium sp. AAP43]|uniref:glycoside hydrolase family 16 protein n=1 Tax=Rhizobium sp. AAP43 TaxID=1523420 RepID=UPI0006B8FB14|nr:glycoside hydrolase family 16 protein [Rhizobium sp. AAP43]KPF41897.1 1,3-1,4-beta-glycanase [Rhizobium sp. AAP43]
MRTTSKWKLRAAAVSIVILGALTALVPYSGSLAEDAPLNLDDFDMTFEENFDTLSVSPWGERSTRWIAHTPWNGDFGAARFSDPLDGFPFTTKDGILRIEARKGDDGNWRAGLLSSTNPRGDGFSQKFGYFEARMKLPPGKGVWPAFWLIGLDRSGFTAEIDVLEYYGRAPYEFSSGYHIWRESHGGKNQNDGFWTAVPEGSLSSDFHTWGVEIKADRTTIYFDRKPVWGFDTPPEFHMPFFPLVNLALGAGWPIDETPNPSYLYVDYIHVYQRKAASPTE